MNRNAKGGRKSRPAPPRSEARLHARRPDRDRFRIRHRRCRKCRGYRSRRPSRRRATRAKRKRRRRSQVRSRGPVRRRSCDRTPPSMPRRSRVLAAALRVCVRASRVGCDHHTHRSPRPRAPNLQTKGPGPSPPFGSLTTTPPRLRQRVRGAEGRSNRRLTFLHRAQRFPPTLRLVHLHAFAASKGLPSESSAKLAIHD